MDQNRRKRIRGLVHNLNKVRRRQAAKIDILCNDMIAAHRDFIHSTQSLSFAVNFYESIIGLADRTRILEATAETIRRHISGAHVAVFLLESDGFELHCVDDENPIDVDAECIEGLFTRELAATICRANWVCSLDDMVQMGLQASPEQLGRISAAAIPLGRYSPGVGFILIYRAAGNRLRRDDLARLTAITPGLVKALRACGPERETSAADPESSSL